MSQQIESVKMALQELGINASGEFYYNPDYDLLIAHETSPELTGAARAVEHHEVWRKAGQLVGAWHDEHVFDKVGLPRHLGDEANAKTGVRAGAAPGVDDVQFFAAQLARDQAFQAAPHVWR